MKKLFGIVLMICGIFILFVTVANSNVGGWFSDQQPVSQSAGLDGIETIEIETSAAQVNVMSENRNNLTAVMRGSHSGNADLTVQRNGSRVKVHIDRHWFNWFSFGDKLRVDVYVPSDYNQNMEIDLHAGKVSVYGQSESDPLVLDELELDMSAGEMNLEYLRVNKLKQDSSTGKVNAEWITAKTASFDISAGDIDIEHYTGGLDADLSAGELTVQMDRLEGSVTMNISAGRASLDLPRDADFTLDSQVSHGNINCEFPLQNMNAYGHDTMKGSHGTGKYKVELEVSNGNIDIY